MILREIKNIFIKNRLTEGVDLHTGLQQIYQNKLIEGEDYETADWLISNSENNSTPFIDTLIPPQLNQVISFTFKVIDSNKNGEEPGVYGVINNSWNKCVIRCYMYKYDYNNIRLEYSNDSYYVSKSGITTSFLVGKEYDCSLSINSSTTALGVINEQSKNLITDSNVSFVLDPQPTHKIFVHTEHAKWSFKSVGFRNFNITNLISLHPCRLLKPIPRNLDAQCKERVEGECGMIDLISGKFYGNVANSGTFTVENDNNE